MNGQEKIIEQILLDASTYAQQLGERAEAEYNTLVETATQNAKKLLKEEAVRAEKDRKEQLARTTVIATLDGKKQVLSAKKRAIDDVFKSALESLNNLDKSAYTSIIDRLLTQHAPENAIVLLAKNTPITEQDFSALESVKAKNLSVEFGGDFLGGVIVKTPTADVNLSFEAILQELYDGLVSSVAERLFGSR